MFKCEVTGKLSAPMEKSVKLVIKTRSKEYSNKKKKEDSKFSETVTTSGFEIVKELMVLASVAKEINEVGYDAYVTKIQSSKLGLRR